MKKNIIGGLLILATSHCASAYSVSFTNIGTADATAVPILDNTGTPIALGSGFASAGTFASRPSGLEDIASFVQFGAGGVTFANEVAGGLAGFFSNKLDAPIPFGTEGAPVGESIYVVIGDGDSLETSQFFAVFDSGQVFTTENAAGQGSSVVDINLASLSGENLIIGEVKDSVFYEAINTTFTSGIQLSDGTAIIPEPSTSLLTALAGFALVARRRR